MNVNQWGAVNQWESGSVTSVTAQITEIALSAIESSSISIVEPGTLAASVTEISTDFDESSNLQLIRDLFVGVTEVSQSASESATVKVPTKRLKPRKIIRVY